MKRSTTNIYSQNNQPRPPSWSFVSTSDPWRSLLTFLKFHVTQLRKWPFRKCSWKLVSLWGSLCTTTSKSMMTSAAVLPSHRSWAHNAAGSRGHRGYLGRKGCISLALPSWIGVAVFSRWHTQRVTQAQQRFIIEFGPFFVVWVEVFSIFETPEFLRASDVCCSLPSWFEPIQMNSVRLQKVLGHLQRNSYSSETTALVETFFPAG